MVQYLRNLNNSHYLCQHGSKVYESHLCCYLSGMSYCDQVHWCYSML